MRLPLRQHELGRRARRRPAVRWSRSPPALLVVAEIVVLLAGVIRRYVFHQPLVWSDELASILFLWLAMLGAVVALPARRAHADDGPRRHGLAARCGRCSTSWRSRRRWPSSLLIVGPAFEFAERETFITTPALEIPNTWRAAALPVGSALMIVSALLRLLGVRTGAWPLGAMVARSSCSWRRCSAAEPVLRGARQPEPADLLRGLVAAHGVRRRADRLLLRAGDLRPTSRSPPTRRSSSWSAAWTRACRT